MDVIMKCDDFVFQFDTITNQVRYRTRATWWRSRPAHNLQRSNGAGLPCHPRTPPKAAQPKTQIQATVQTMLTAKRNVGTTCENVKRRWRVASAGSWAFGLSETSANLNTGKDLGTKLFDTSASLFIDTSVDGLSGNQVVHYSLVTISLCPTFRRSRSSCCAFHFRHSLFTHCEKATRTRKEICAKPITQKMRYP